MMSLARRTYLALWLAVVLAIGVTLLQSGIYGWMLFVIVPFALGLLGAAIVRPSTAAVAATVGAAAVLLGALLLLAFAIEGALCIAMALPLVLPLGSLGAWAGFRLQETNISAQSGSVMLVLPLAALAWDVKAPPLVFHVTTQIVVQATPEKVWKYVVSVPKLPDDREWVFRAGLAYPTEVRLNGNGPGAVRYCRFSTGSFVEPITIWDEPHLLRFRVTQSPSPLHEWSPWGEIRPKHLHGYFVSEQGEFRLAALPGGRTLLTGTSWYRHGLWPAAYWRWWSDQIIHRIHLRVLDHVRDLTEREARSQ